MASDNVNVTAGSGTAVRTLADGSNVEWPVGVVCYATTVSAGANVLQVVTPSAPLPVSLTTATTGGATPYSYIAAASSNQDSQVVKNTAGQVYGWQLFNMSAATRYVKIYDKATAATSADTPIKRFMVPAGGGTIVPMSNGIAYANGIAFRITVNYADNDATAATAGDVIVNCNYR